MSYTISQIPSTRTLPAADDYIEIGGVTNGSAKNPLLNFQQKVTSIAALKALAVAGIADGVCVTVQGYYAAGDGGGGVFNYSSGSAAADDGGSVIAPNVGAGRWLRAFPDVVSVRCFGAKGDNVTDDTAKIQAAINFVQTAGGGIVYLPRGQYVVTDNLLVTNNRVTIRGEQVGQSVAMGTTLKTTAANKDVILVSGVAQPIAGFALESLNIIGNPAGASGNGLRCLSYVGNAVAQVSLSKVSFLNCAEHGLHLDATAGFIFTVSIRDVISTANNLAGLRFTGSVSQVSADSIYSEGNGSHQVDIYGTTPNNAGGMSFRRCTAASAPVNYGGVRLRYADSVTFLDYYTESNTTYEALILSCTSIRFFGGTVKQNGVSKGFVIGFDGANPTKNVRIDIPGWTNTTANKRVDVSLFAGSVFYWLHFGYNADGPFTTADINGIAAIAGADSNAVNFDVKDSAFSSVAYPGTALVTATGKTVASIVLQPGNWLVQGVLSYAITGGGPCTDVLGGISNVDNTMPAAGLYTENRVNNLTGGGQTAVAPTRRFALTAQTTIYLVAFANFSGGAVSAYGNITAQRV
jgi:hypothetical protein